MPDLFASGYKGQLVPPGIDTSIIPPPAENPPPEVQATSVLGIILRYALEDHTHRSPVIYWPQGAGATNNIKGNRLAANSPMGAGLSGAINLSTDTTALTTGVTANYAGLFAGDANQVSVPYSVILGGTGNTISTALTGVFIGAGDANVAQGDNSAVVAGANNGAGGARSFVGAGDTNTAVDDDDAVLAGSGNTCGGGASGIVSGVGNQTTGDSCFIGAGTNNTAASGSAGVVAGTGNSASTTYSFVGAGEDNTCAGARGGVVAGTTNIQNASSGIIGAGSNNTNGSTNGGIFAGDGNLTNASSRVCIGAGAGNTIDDTSNDSIIGAGTDNTITGSLNAFIGAGDGNAIDTGPECGIAFGAGCSITSSDRCGASGTLCIIVDATDSVIAGGNNNVIDGGPLGTSLLYGTIGGGTGNRVSIHAGTVRGGYSADAYIPGADAFASGAAAGEEFWSQESTIILRGSTPGAGADESVELLPYVGALAARALVIKGNRVYSAVLQIGTIRASDGTVRSILINAAVRVDGAGAITIPSQSTVSTVGNGVAYAVTLSAGAAPTRLVVTLNTGAGNTHAVRATAKLTLVEQATA